MSFEIKVHGTLFIVWVLIIRIVEKMYPSGWLVANFCQQQQLHFNSFAFYNFRLRTKKRNFHPNCDFFSSSTKTTSVELNTEKEDQEKSATSITSSWETLRGGSSQTSSIVPSPLDNDDLFQSPQRFRKRFSLSYKKNRASANVPNKEGKFNPSYSCVNCRISFVW